MTRDRIILYGVHFYLENFNLFLLRKFIVSETSSEILLWSEYFIHILDIIIIASCDSLHFPRNSRGDMIVKKSYFKFGS